MAGHNLQIEQEGLLHALTGEWLARCEDFRNGECSGGLSPVVMVPEAPAP